MCPSSSSIFYENWKDSLSFFNGEEKSSKLIFWWIDTCAAMCMFVIVKIVGLILQGFWVWFLMSGKVSLWHISGGNSNRLLLHKSAGSDKEDPTCFGILEILLAFSPYQFCLKPLLLTKNERKIESSNLLRQEFWVCWLFIEDQNKFVFLEPL